MGIAEALHRPHDRAVAPPRLAALLRRAAVLVGRDGVPIICGPTQTPMVHFEGLAVAWVAAPAMEEVHE